MKNATKDSSTVDELFLAIATYHSANYPFLEIASISEGGGSARLSQGLVRELSIEEKRIELRIWGNAIEEGGVVLGLIEE
ncbi:MAG: hypothetical protein ACPGVB_00120 [Chitinophagales bacterium]